LGSVWLAHHIGFALRGRILAVERVALMIRREPCSINGCGIQAKARGWCSAHYHRWQRHGDPLGGGTSDGEPERYFREVVLQYEGEGCLVWPYARSAGGYGLLGGKVASRILCEEVNGSPPSPLHHAAHNCGNGAGGCVTQNHIAWKTKTENEADKRLHGTDPRGERNGSAKLNADAVAAIRALQGKKTIRALAKDFGVGTATICRVQSREGWSHVGD
jgi:hypothetical protein